MRLSCCAVGTGYVNDATCARRAWPSLDLDKVGLLGLGHGHLLKGWGRGLLQRNHRLGLVGGNFQGQRLAPNLDALKNVLNLTRRQLLSQRTHSDSK